MMKNRHGFTLVELSIVLVILGLLIGGVLTGQSLIRAAELRSVSTQYSRYVTAVQTFRDKYFALPGDMTNATAYWGAADGGTGTTASCKTTTTGTSATCNGDGDGKITNSPVGSAEWFRFWQHLANAGLIEGNYTGVGTGMVVGNVPQGRISGSFWFVNNWGTSASVATFFDGQYDNSFEFGAAGSTDPNSPLVKTEDAYNIDVKLDDGKPATGKVVIRGTYSSCTDASTSTALTANYLLTNTAIACVLIFRQQF